MRMVHPAHESRNRATEALKSLLDQVSQIKLKSIETQMPHPADLKVDILAQVEVHGHSHTLVCKVNACGRPDHILVALKEFQSMDGSLGERVMPVMIAPHLSAEAKALCGANKAGFLDLDGNAHLELGDVFIVRRTSHKFTHRVAAPSLERDEELAVVA